MFEICFRLQAYVAAEGFHLINSSPDWVHSSFIPQGDSVPAGDDGPFADTVTLEQKTSSIGGTSGKVSLWMQWMLPKVTVKLFASDLTAKKAGTLTLY